MKTVRESTNFKKLLEIVLAIGNYMNGGTNRGGVYGFKLDSLLKVSYKIFFAIKPISWKT